MRFFPQTHGPLSALSPPPQTLAQGTFQSFSTPSNVYNIEYSNKLLSLDLKTHGLVMSLRQKHAFRFIHSTNTHSVAAFMSGLV